jgi:hypothetical protein
MNKAYQVVFECPKGHHTINLQRKSTRASLSEKEAMKLFGNEVVSCPNPGCGWHGKASKTRVLRVLSFNWLYSPAA